MQLFLVQAGKRVRVTSRLIRWAERGVEKKVAEGVTWEGTATDKYYHYKGCRRRLITNHTMEGWAEYGIWQRDVEVEVIE